MFSFTNQHRNANQKHEKVVLQASKYNDQKRQKVTTADQNLEKRKLPHTVGGNVN